MKWVSQIRYLRMFIRKKENKSGSTCIQIINKTSGSYKVFKTVGSSSDSKIIQNYIQEAQRIIKNLSGDLQLNFQEDKEEELVNIFFDSVTDFKLVGPEIVLGKLFNEIGFNKIENTLFRHLVITRLVYPASKLKTVDYLYKYKGISIPVGRVYRSLDKLYEEQIEQIQRIGYQHSQRISFEQQSLVFYDVTTLYFEAEEEDDLRKAGFSKDGKNQHPQILLGLLVNSMGYPLAYEIFEGNKFEGHTMLPVIEAFKKKFKIEKLVVVADAGLMSNKNIKELCDKNYLFIVGARIKNESEKIKTKILSLHLSDSSSAVIKKEDGQRLIIGYSSQRSKKDEHNRKRGLVKLEKSIATGKLTKKQITNRGYNKYLKIDGDASVSIDYDKFNDDARWDGLKGYLTNTSLSKQEVIEQYKKLWQIEKTFRISKTDLRIRPIFHYNNRRIRAHISIAFAACLLYKELERQLKIKKSVLSPERAIEILKTIYSMSIITPYSKKQHTRLIIKTEEQKQLLELFT